MKFLVDAQLPRRLAIQLNTAGHDAVHTLSLPQKNRTKDGVINQISIGEQRVVITKDVDFRDSHLVQGRPFKLLLISTGNIRNDELLVLIERNLPTIVTAFESHSYLELDRNHLTIHQ
jgi:predicted nuclease of predicted toxin-antitoxin system